MDCIYCEKTFSSKYTLKTHQIKALYCLKIQGKSNEKKEFTCEKCGVEFTVKNSFTNHLKNCKSKQTSLKETILEKDEEISKLKRIIKTLRMKNKETKEREIDIKNRYSDIVQTLAKKSTVTKNYTKNITTNHLSVFDKSEEDIDKSVQDNYTEYHLRNGQKGVAWFTYDHITKNLPEEKPKYLISDKSRGHGVYKDNETNLIQDTYMGNLTHKIYPSIKRKATSIAQGSNGDIFSDKQLLDGWHDTQKMEEDNTGFCKEYIKKSALL